MRVLIAFSLLAFALAAQAQLYRAKLWRSPNRWSTRCAKGLAGGDVSDELPQLCLRVACW